MREADSEAAMRRRMHADEILPLGCMHINELSNLKCIELDGCAPNYAAQALLYAQ